MRGTVIRRWAGAVAGLAVATTVAGARAGAQAAGAPDTRPTIAVLYFNATAMVKRDEYAPLNKGIAELLITELAANPRIRVVEREQLQQILDEQNLGAGDRVDKETAVRGTQILLLEERLELVALDHADVGVRRELGDQHLGDPLAERRELVVAKERGVREVHDGERGAPVGGGRPRARALGDADGRRERQDRRGRRHPPPDSHCLHGTPRYL